MGKNIHFEDAMLKLEDIVIKLESGSLSLDESIKEFENAVTLIKLCESHLSNAKQKVRILTEGEDGTVSDKPFINENDDAS